MSLTGRLRERFSCNFLNRVLCRSVTSCWYQCRGKKVAIALRLFSVPFFFVLFLLLNAEGDDRIVMVLRFEKKVIKARPIAASQPLNAPYSRLSLYKYCVKIPSRSPKGGNIKTRKVAVKTIFEKRQPINAAAVERNQTQ